jgi:glycerophosphoryl diester phosphodiesterase
MPAERDRPLTVIAHRGASGYAPEHTFAAWDLALEMGSTHIEQDLQMTADGVLVVLHDGTLDRTANGTSGLCSGPVGERTSEELDTCEVGSWFNVERPQHREAAYAAEGIPELADVFRRYGHDVRYYIETKQPEASPGMDEALVRLLRRYDLIPERPSASLVLIQSFSPTSLRRIHELEPTLPLVQLYGGREWTSERIRSTLDEVATYAVGIGPYWRDTDLGLVQAVHERCMVIHPYTVNEAADLEQMLGLDVDGMFTDLPDRLIALAETSGRRVGPPEIGVCH